MPLVSVKDKRVGDFVLVPRQEYKELLDLKKTFKNKMGEIRNTDTAIKVYLREKKQKKLRVLKSLADLN